MLYIPATEHKCPGTDINQLFEKGREDFSPKSTMYNKMSLENMHVQTTSNLCSVLQWMSSCSCYFDPAVIKFPQFNL